MTPRRSYFRPTQRPSHNKTSYTDVPEYKPSADLHSPGTRYVLGQKLHIDTISASLEFDTGMLQLSENTPWAGLRLQQPDTNYGIIWKLTTMALVTTQAQDHLQSGYRCPKTSPIIMPNYTHLPRSTRLAEIYPPQAMMQAHDYLLQNTPVTAN